MRKLILLVSSVILLTPLISNGQGVTISQFQRVTYSDFLIDRSGAYHTVYLESPAIGKPRFVYYSRSVNGGRAWSKPVAVSNDETGNGSAAPRLIEDGRGEVYAIWKRWGATNSNYPVDDTILEGIGGYAAGTLYFTTVTGGVPGKLSRIGEKEESVISWFPTLDPAGNVTLVWSQISDESHQSNLKAWYYADWIRAAKLQEGAVGPISSLTRPAPPAYKGGAPPDQGYMNLHGFITPSGQVRLVAERMFEKGQTVFYFDGKSFRKVYSYPKYTSFNNFNHPARLLVDETGKEHVILKPASQTLDSEQLWDMDPATGNKNVLVALQSQGVQIGGFQAYQGPGGRLTVAFQAGGISEAKEAFLCTYTAGVWKSFGITRNAAKGSFGYKEFPFDGSYRPILGALKRYDTTFVAVAHDAGGARRAMMTVAEYFSTGAFSTTSPSLVFIGAVEAAPAKAPAAGAGRRN